MGPQHDFYTCGQPDAAREKFVQRPLTSHYATIMFLSRGGIWLVLAPFFVAVALVALMLIYPFTGIGPANNIFALCALATIILGLVVGVISLFLAKFI